MDPLYMYKQWSWDLNHVWQITNPGDFTRVFCQSFQALLFGISQQHRHHHPVVDESIQLIV